MKYKTHPEFERASVALCLTNAGVWRRVGKHVTPDALNIQEACDAFALARDIAGESGVPGGVGVVLQSAMGKVEDGTMSEVGYKALVNWVEDALDDFLDGKWDPAATEKELAACVRRHETDAAATSVVDAWAKGNPDKLRDGLDRVSAADKIGQESDSGAEVRTLDERIGEIQKSGVTELLEYGMSEVDALCNGGRNRGCVSLVGGGTGDGKSICLSQSAAVAMTRGLFVGIASTELRPYLISARVEACLFGLNIDDIRTDPEVLRGYYEEHGDRLGPLVIKQFEPGPGVHTRVSDIEDWIKRVEDNQGRALEVLALDPIDRLRPSVSHFKGSDYSAGEHVMDELCQMADDRRLWLDGSSHAVRRKTGAFWTENDLSDSQHKARRSDRLITVNASGPKGTRMMAINVCKDREGGGRGVVGPYPARFEIGRLIPMLLLEAEDVYADL